MLDKRDTLPKEDQEKKQLEEIAHLYFSKPAAPSKAGKRAEKRERAVQSFRRLPQGLFVYCTAGEPGHVLAASFLFNLAVMLRILNGPVLLIGSERVYEHRFTFGFRPDRERLTQGGRPPLPSSVFGPMGVCLLEGRSFLGGFAAEKARYVEGRAAGGSVSFQYILSDEARSSSLIGALPGLAIFLATPATTTEALSDLDREEGEKAFPRFGHVGIVVLGAGCEEEAAALYLYWREKLETKCGGDLNVDNFGMFPADRGLADRKLGRVEVLESPGSAQARWYQLTASLIRRKRSEMVAGFDR